MRFTAQDVRRVWFIACETVVLGTPLVLLLSGRGQLAACVDLLRPTFNLAWPTLLATSFIFFRFDRRLAVVGFISCLFGALWWLLPVLAV